MVEETVKTLSKDEEKLLEMERTFASKLPGAVDGEVVTRFPPEASGYLHIGHAKASLINRFYAHYFHGKLIIRFDDTNPTKEKQEFEDAIVEDLKLLKVMGNEKANYEVIGPTYASDYFPQIQEAMEKLIKENKAYIDDTEHETMKKERFDGIESKCRNQTVEENLRRWSEMLQGSDEGRTMCARAKISMTNKNKALRDPVMYRCNVDTPHHRQGTKYKAYPTYDFECPLVDSWSGVTHALRTNEYADRIPQYAWVQENTGVRKTIIYEFSRLNFSNTVLSKRKLQWLVDTGVVDSWEDPRFPTVRGLLRRGLQVEAIHEFLMEQGPSKNSNLMEWDKLWSKNQKVLDPISKRFMSVNASAIPVRIRDFQVGVTVNKMRPLHPKNAQLGELPLCITETVFIEHEDAQMCEEHEELTLMRLGNVIIERLERNQSGQVQTINVALNVEGDVKKTKKKLHWIPETSQHFGKQVPFVYREYDHLITKRKPEENDSMEDIINRNSLFDTDCIAEPGVADLKEGDIIQFERRGYVRVDKIRESDGKRIMIAIPTGKMKAMSTLSTKVDAAVLTKGGNTPVKVVDTPAAAK